MIVIGAAGTAIVRIIQMTFPQDSHDRLALWRDLLHLPHVNDADHAPLHRRSGRERATHRQPRDRRAKADGNG
jgi:hypothetical protein